MHHYGNFDVRHNPLGEGSRPDFLTRGIDADKNIAMAPTSFPSSTKQKYICVLDFEKTCEKDVRLDPQEIIEFPSVLLCADRIVPDVEFHCYVRPSVNPFLTNFCTELT